MDVKNTSGMHPLGRAVLVKPYEPERKESLIALPKSVHERQMMIDQRVVVVECGPACWPDEPPRAKVGDLVLIAKMSGYFVSNELAEDAQNYLIINDRDIFCGLTEKNHE